jgi:hypothetical protein
VVFVRDAIEFTHGLVATVYNKDERIQRLWKISFSKSGNEFFESLYRIGQPMRYEYVSEPWEEYSVNSKTAEQIKKHMTEVEG